MKNYALIILFSALASIVAIPVSGSFRITLGIVVVIAAIEAFRIRKPILLAFLAGLAVCLTRILVDSFSGTMTATLASNYLLEFFFYVGYGTLYHVATTNNRSSYPLPLVVTLVLADAGGNFFEYFIRSLASDQAWATTSLTAILLAAFVRSVLIVLLVWFLTNYVSPKLGIEGGRND